ncbi:MAG: membrane protein insertase YidC [Verrucomicrobiales bacterium]|nr:membrane protein insertase YidC [Verrucomicrobiales bacterium]
MDRTSVIILAICFVLFVLWSVHMQRYYSRRPGPTKPVATATTNEFQTNAAAAPKHGHALRPAHAQEPFTFVRPSATEELVTLTNEVARYTFSSHGGGLKLVELVRYPQTISARSTKRGQTAPEFASLNTRAPVPVLALLGDTAIQGDGLFKLVRTASGIHAEQAHTNGLLIVKKFELSSNYLLKASIELHNTSTQSVTLPPHQVVIGTATPMDPDDDGTYVNLLWYNGSEAEQIGQAWFENRFLGCFPGKPRFVYRAGQTNVVWASVNNRFFTLAAMPKTPAHELVAVPVILPQPDTHTGNTKPAARSNLGYQVALNYPECTLAPNQTVSIEYHLFAGPKEYRTLARIGEQFNNELQAIMGFERVLGGRFTAFFAKLLLVSMNGLHDLLKLGYGWVIIIITFIIKILFWPLTYASMRSMRRMQALQPQIKAIQEKYKDDPAKLNRKLMEFWKENKVNPFGGCLPILLQMPVFIGFYIMIHSAIELRGARFLWVNDLSKPDTLFVIPGLNFIPFLSTPEGLPFNLLPLLMVATMLWQSHMTPVAPGMDPMQAKILRWMPLFFLLFLYNFSAGLTLYWTVQNLLSIAQMKLTKIELPAPAAAAPAPAKPAPPGRKK